MNQRTRRSTARISRWNRIKGGIANGWGGQCCFVLPFTRGYPTGGIRPGRETGRTHPTGPHGIPDPWIPPKLLPDPSATTHLHPLKGKPFRLLGEIPPSHHTNEPRPRTKMPSGESRKFTCSVCGKHYQQSSHLRRHERTRMQSTFLSSIQAA
jgi:hypothetical protein